MKKVYIVMQQRSDYTICIKAFKRLDRAHELMLSNKSYFVSYVALDDARTTLKKV